VWGDTGITRRRSGVPRTLFGIPGIFRTQAPPRKYTSRGMYISAKSYVPSSGRMYLSAELVDPLLEGARRTRAPRARLRRRSREQPLARLERKLPSTGTRRSRA